MFPEIQSTAMPEAIEKFVLCKMYFDRSIIRAFQYHYYFRRKGSTETAETQVFQTLLKLTSFEIVESHEGFIMYKHCGIRFSAYSRTNLYFPGKL